MSEKITLPALRLIRGHLKGSMTKLASYAEAIDDSVSLSELRVRYIKAEELWKEFKASQNRMYEFADSETYSDPLPDFEEFESKFLVVSSVLLSAINEREKVEKASDAIGRLADQQQILVKTLSQNNSSEKGADFFLPKIHIEPFSGNYQKWPTFRDMFEGAVHNKTSLTPIQKFHFLKSCLRNEALSLLNHLPICDATYEQAWERLEKRYDRPRYVINSYVKAFFDLPSSNNSNVNLLRKLSDGADEIVKGLTSLNSRNRDPWLIHILLNKLDPDTRQAWSEDSVEEDYPTIDEFLLFLDRRCEALESCRTYVKENNRQRNQAVKSMHASSPSILCPKCSASHSLSQCPEFLSMEVSSRREFVKSNRLCFNCLRCGHSAARCQSKFRCRTCNTRHHSLVHDHSVNTTNTNPSNNSLTANVHNQEHSEAIPFETYNFASTSSQVQPVSSHLSVNFARQVPQTLLPTAIGKVLDITGQYQQVRILIDTGSQVSFVSESCAQRLGHKRRNARIPISGIGFTNAGQSRGLLSMVIASRTDSCSITVDTYILSNVTSNLPTTSFSIEDWDHLQSLTLADPSFNNSGPIDVLLGADKAWEILQGDIVRNKKGYPIAHKTIFGWVLAGELPFSNHSQIVTHHALLDIDSILQSFWTIEEVDPKSIISKEDAEIEGHFLSTHRRDMNGKYIVNLPFKSAPRFADTLNGATARLKWMEGKFEKNQNLFKGYSSFLEEYLNLGHMTKIPDSEVAKSNVFYLPHHAVLKPDSTSTKLRVVFDGSFKDSTGNSLNDSLMIGPPIQRDLFSVCLRFRRHRFVFTADIVKMFRQIWVSDKDTDFQRIVWRKSPSEPLEHYRLRTVTYGTSCAPFLSVRVLQQLAEDYKDQYPIASEIVRNDFYVDDVVSGGESLSEAIMKRDSLIELISKCGMKLSKWQSNCSELLQGETILTGTNVTLDTVSDSWTKVLGIHWNPKSDVFSFHLNYIPNEVITKRQILKDVARIFDPLGFLAPTVVQLKIIFQELWLLKLKWNEEVPLNIAARWSACRDELSILTQIQIPRVIGLSNNSFQIHGFSDASASAYAAVIYARYQLPNGCFTTNIIAAKTRVAPIKQLSIPRLELCGAVLLSRLLVAVQKSLNITFSNVYAWSDSSIVLSWLSSPPRRWNVFVGNRTSEILNTIPRNRWYHVRSEYNPADCASRGISPSHLIKHPIWWTGPNWLRKSVEHWPVVSSFVEDPTCNLEAKKVTPYSHVVTNNDHPFERLSNNVSKWVILIRAIARIHRFIDNSRRRSRYHSEYLNPREFYDAKTEIITWLQQRYFGDEIKFFKSNKFFPKSSKLISLSPFIDDKNILRVGGRIQHANLSFNVKHPIIIPKGHAITKLIALDAHIRYLHPGTSALFALIRQEYYIIGCRNLLRQITHDCIQCFRQRKDTIDQIMADLPQFRLESTRPFTHCGCDYAGPITLKVKAQRKSYFSKGYISLFVCLVSKAIHLELVSDLTTDAFLAALRRFTARRGKPSHIYSDNGTNFRGTARLLSEMHELVLAENHNSLVAESLARDGITWHFIPPSAPHFGGLWEAGVKSAKLQLRRVIGNDILTFEQYYTLLTQIEAILNSRPLCQISDTDIDPLTPAHFFLGESYAAIPEPMLDLPLNRLSSWQALQSKIQGYWKRWQIEYLTSLQHRPRWQQPRVDIKCNDLVVIKDANLPPGKWALGRVLKTHPGKDGHVRVVTLKTANGHLIRPIHKLAVLPVC